jgi:hypothetical protein
MFVRVAGLLLATGLLLGACAGHVVREPDCGNCRPIEMSMDQVFELTAGTDRALSSDPSLHDPVMVDPGTMNVISEECGVHNEPEDEFVGGISEYCTWQLEPTSPGETEVVVGLLPVGGGTAESQQVYEVIISE